MGVFLLGALLGGLVAFVWASYRKAEQHREKQRKFYTKTRDWRAGLDAALDEAGIDLNTHPRIEESDGGPVYLTGFEYQVEHCGREASLVFQVESPELLAESAPKVPPRWPNPYTDAGIPAYQKYPFLQRNYGES